MTLSVLQISDCHLVVPGARLIGVDTQASLEAVLEHASGERKPDAIVASGDLAHDPHPEVYARFVETVRNYSDAPLMCLPGNHDVLGVMEAAELPLAPLHVGSWSLVPLDSHEDELPVALITEADRARVADLIANAPGANCIVASHHPMVMVDCPWLDKDRIHNGAELIEWLSECSAIDGTSRLRSVVFGHAHQDIADVCAEVPVFGAPSTCFQFMPGSNEFSLDTACPGYRWLQLADDGSVATEVRRVDSFPIQVRLDR